MFFPLHDHNNDPVKVTPVITYTIIAVNLLVFGYQYLLSQSGEFLLVRRFILTHGMVPAEILSSPQMLITYQFLHGNFLHVFGNLWFFWIFSDNVEERLGRIAYLFFYLIAGTAAGIAHGISSEAPLIGASGAVAGVMGAYVVMFPQNRITSYVCPIWVFIRRIDVPAWMVLGFYLFLQSFAFWNSDLLKTNISFGCHVGGFVAGAVMAFRFRPAVGLSPAGGASA